MNAMEKSWGIGAIGREKKREVAYRVWEKKNDEEGGTFNRTALDTTSTSATATQIIKRYDTKPCGTFLTYSKLCTSFLTVMQKLKRI